MTGMSSSLSSSCTIDGSMLATSPTKPSRSSRISTVMSPASSPDSPTAYEPCWLSAATISRLTLPTSAMRTMSTLSASVTRSPSTNSGSLPSRRMRSVICGPPPCTTTGFMPTSRMSTTSWANRSASAGSSIAWPPYLITTVAPGELADVRQRLGEDRAPSARAIARAVADVVASDVPMFSSTYAWVRSVNSIVASPLPSCRSQVIVDVALRPSTAATAVVVVRRGDAVATHGDAVVGDRRPARDRTPRRSRRARRGPGPSRGPCRRASTARAGSHATVRAASCAPRPACGRRAP